MLWHFGKDRWIKERQVKEMAKKQTACRDRLGELAPKFAELNDDVHLEKCGQERKS